MRTSLPVTPRGTKKWTDQDPTLAKLCHSLLDHSKKNWSAQLGNLLVHSQFTSLVHYPEMHFCAQGLWTLSAQASFQVAHSSSFCCGWKWCSKLPWFQTLSGASCWTECSRWMYLWRSCSLVLPPGRSCRILEQHGRPRILKQLHVGHPGISRIKNLARSFVWWPVDYAGPYFGHIFLVTVDAHSKWMEINVWKLATSTSTITHPPRTSWTVSIWQSVRVY